MHLRAFERKDWPLFHLSDANSYGQLLTPPPDKAGPHDHVLDE